MISIGGASQEDDDRTPHNAEEDEVDDLPPPPTWFDPEQVRSESLEFLWLLEREAVLPPERVQPRMAQIESAISLTRTYSHTYPELQYGARVALRNDARCVERLFWPRLVVRDLRHLDEADDIFAALVDHIRDATNGGRIVPMVSVFAPQEPGSPGIRIWNRNLIGYAGYRRSDGSVLGDPANLEFTSLAMRLGWKGGAHTPFDLLPLIIQVPGGKPQIYDLPEDAVLEVQLRHPDFGWFEELGLKWHALSTMSNMRLEIGGVSYPSAPLSGWFIGTEIGARSLSDVERYNLLPAVARCMGLDTRSNRALWRDRALVELNVAVLHSFQEDGVTIVDHHTASQHFIRHEAIEREADRTVPAEWRWIVPPISGSATEVFHREYHNTILRPNFFPQPDAWEVFLPRRPHPRLEVQQEEMDRDAQTGMLHRGALDRRLFQFGKQGGVIAVIDLDGFSAINEEYGQAIGDQLLKAAAQTVIGTVRPDDVCARLGGDSFCLLLPRIETDDAAIGVAERIRSALLRVHLETGAPYIPLTASIGMTAVVAGSNVKSAIGRAEAAVLRAKVDGGDSITMVGAGDAPASRAAGPIFPFMGKPHPGRPGS